MNREPSGTTFWECASCGQRMASNVTSVNAVCPDCELTRSARIDLVHEMLKTRGLEPRRYPLRGH
jgi:predicted RNA-binding Zn-ribbon protein involved in translation (DUF1610 family)